MTSAACYRTFLQAKTVVKATPLAALEEPDLGGGSEMLAAELQLAACLSMGFDGGRASSL